MQHMPTEIHDGNVSKIVKALRKACRRPLFEDIYMLDRNQSRLIEKERDQAKTTTTTTTTTTSNSPTKGESTNSPLTRPQESESSYGDETAGGNSYDNLSWCEVRSVARKWRLSIY